MKKQNKIELNKQDINKANKTLDDIYNTAQKMSSEKNKDNRKFKVMKRGNEIVIKFNDEYQQEITIPAKAYEEIKDGLESEKYEPENLGQDMREWFSQYKINSLKDKDTVGECHRCSLIVKQGEGVLLVNQDVVFHRNPCFKLDRKYFGHVYVK